MTSTGSGRSHQTRAFSPTGLTAFQDELRKIGEMLSAKIPKPKLPKSSVPTPKAPTARGMKAVYTTGGSEGAPPPDVTGTSVPGKVIGTPTR